MQLLFSYSWAQVKLSGGHYVAEASKVLFLLSCWKTIAEEVKGLVLMKPPGVQVLRAAGQTSKDEVFPSWGQTVIVYPNCTTPGGRASLVGGTWVFEHSCMVAGLKPCWNEELQSWCPEAAALYFLSVFLKSHNLKKSLLYVSKGCPHWIKIFTFSYLRELLLVRDFQLWSE